MPVSQTCHEQRGVSALLVAGSMLLLMGMAAIAIDLGAAYNERRQDQSAADAAALAAGLELILGNQELDAVTEAKALVDENLGRVLHDPSAPATDTAWINCTDPGALNSTNVPGLDPSQPCISFGDGPNGQAFGKIRVRVPDQTTATTFGRILGVLAIDTFAIAEVDLVPLLEQGAFPASVFNGAPAGGTVCIKTGTGSSNQTSCGDPSTGNFGSFNPYFYREVNPTNPASICNSGGSVEALGYVMSNGLDHSLGIAPGENQGTAVNGATCPGSPGPINPDRVRSGSGYSNDDVTKGLISGGTFDSTPYVGRLTKPPSVDDPSDDWSGNHGTITVFGENLDNRPLWTFLDSTQAVLADAAITADTAPGPLFDRCEQASQGPNSISDTDPLSQEWQDFTDAEAHLVACLTAYANLTAGDVLEDGIFVELLFDSPRLTIVPEYHQSAPIGNNACCYDLADFRPVYLNSIWTANGPQWTCDGAVESVPGDFCRHDPGREGTITINAAGQRRVNSANAIVLNCDMLAGVDAPAEKCKKIEVIGGGTATNFINLFLTR